MPGKDELQEWPNAASVLVVVSSMGTGGVAQVISNLAEGLAHRGYKVTIVSIAGDVKRPPLPEIATHSLHASLRTLKGVVKAVAGLRSVLNTVQPDIVHSHAFHANMLCRLTGVLYGRQFTLVSTTHSTAEGPERNRILAALTSWASDMNTAVSNAVAVSQPRIFRRESATPVIRNGIRTENFSFHPAARRSIREQLGIPPDAFLILTVARLSPSKDYATLLKAFSVVLQSLPNARLVAVGAGPEREAVLGMAQGLELGDRAIFVGERSDIREIMSASDVFVLSSRWEGLGLVISEAMCVGIPCVASNVGGIPEVAGGHASLVIPGSATDLSAKIIEIAYAPPSEEKLQQARKFTVEHFSRESMLLGYIDAYANALEVRRQKGRSRYAENE